DVALRAEFGIGALVGAGEGGTKPGTGFTVGTVQYMSPEQALGQANLDGRSYLYAFGAMLYQMVTGAPPYDGASSAEIVGKHLADPVPVASDVNARIPRWLSDVIVKCLAKKPEDRYQTGDEVLAALRAGRASGPTQLVGAASVERQVRRSGELRPAPTRLRWRLLGGVARAPRAGPPGSGDRGRAGRAELFRAAHQQHHAVRHHLGSESGHRGREALQLRGAERRGAHPHRLLPAVCELRRRGLQHRASLHR